MATQRGYAEKSKRGYFGIEHAGTDSVVDIYDVENLYFSDGQNGYEHKLLTEGQVIGKDSWHGDFAGTEIDYEDHNVSFVVDGDTLKVMADVSVEVVEEQFTERYYWTNPGDRFAGRTWYEDQLPHINFQTHSLWGRSERIFELISLGVQKFTKEMSGVIWEGSRLAVDEFQFADGVFVNVINVSTTNLADEPVFDTFGTEGIDLIFGNASANLIDGKGGDDIIFGGDGDDVIIGGEGDDVILGGNGADILRGDMVESGDGAVTAWQAAATQFNADNPTNSITFDENKLSIEKAFLLR